MENKIFDYPQICDKIKNLDEKIQFVSVINEKGNLITGGTSDDSESTQNKDSMKICMKKLQQESNCVRNLIWF